MARITSDMSATSYAAPNMVPDMLHDALCHVLGNTCRIGRTAASYQWNVTGACAMSAAICFRDQAKELNQSLDDFAEHIRSLGAMAILDYSDSVVAVDPPTAAAVPPIREMFSNLHGGHVQACLSIKAAIDISKECDDEPSIQILARRLSAHRRHILRMSLTCDEAQE